MTIYQVTEHLFIGSQDSCLLGQHYNKGMNKYCKGESLAAITTSVTGSRGQCITKLGHVKHLCSDCRLCLGPLRARYRPLPRHIRKTILCNPFNENNTFTTMTLRSRLKLGRVKTIHSLHPYLAFCSEPRIATDIHECLGN